MLLELDCFAVRESIGGAGKLFRLFLASPLPSGTGVRVDGHMDRRAISPLTLKAPDINHELRAPSWSWEHPMIQRISARPGGAESAGLLRTIHVSCLTPSLQAGTEQAGAIGSFQEFGG